MTSVPGPRTSPTGWSSLIAIRTSPARTSTHPSRPALIGPESQTRATLTRSRLHPDTGRSGCVLPTIAVGVAELLPPSRRTRAVGLWQLRKSRAVSNTYFVRVNWVSGDPVVLWSHVVDGWEVRKVEESTGGHLDWADADHETGSTMLSQEPMPPPAEITVDPQFTVGLIDESTIELMWSRARTNFSSAVGSLDQAVRSDHGPSALANAARARTAVGAELRARSPTDNPPGEKRECHHADGEQNPPRDRYARKDDGGSTGGKGLGGQRLIGEPAEGRGSHRRDQSDHDRDGTCNGDQRRTCPEEHGSTSSDGHSSTLTARASAARPHRLVSWLRCLSVMHVNPSRASRPRRCPKRAPPPPTTR